MNEITKEQKVILQLIKASMFHIEPEFPDDTNWEKVYEIARSQCIVSLLEPSVPIGYRAKWSEDYCQNIANFVRITYEQDELIKLFKSNDIPIVILKGMAAAMYYPEPQRRTLGDIDFLVPADRYDYVKKLLIENGYQYIGEDNRHSEYEKNGIEAEVHRKFCSVTYNNVEHIYENGMKNAREYKVNCLVFPGMSTYENGLVLLGHMMQHLKGCGLGLRQVIDWMMYVHNELDDEAWENHFRPFAEEAGLEKLALASTYMCKKWLGLRDNITWCDKADEELAEIMIKRIFADGNFGKNRLSSVNVRLKMKKEGMFKYLQHAGMANWSLAQKYPIFRPFAWLYQIFRYIRNGIFALFEGKNELKGIKSSSDVEKLTKMLE